MKLSYDTMSPREQQLVKYGGIAAIAMLSFGVLLPLNSSVAKSAVARQPEETSGPGVDARGCSRAGDHRTGASGQ